MLMFQQYCTVTIETILSIFHSSKRVSIFNNFFVFIGNMYLSSALYFDAASYKMC